MTDRPCQRPGCDNLIPSRKRKDARWCSRKCEGRATRAAKRTGIDLADYGNGVSYSSMESPAELHERARPPQHWTDDPRSFSDFGELPDDYDIAAEIDAADEDDEQAARYHALFQEDADRTPKDTWRRWRAYGRRHGTEHPEQTADRIQRHRAAQAASMARIDRSTAGRIQDRFDARTSANIAQNAVQSRALNARHVDRPPVPQQAFDFTAEQVTGDFYRSGRPAGQMSGHADYTWDLGATGFIHSGS